VRRIAELLARPAIGRLTLDEIVLLDARNSISPSPSAWAARSPILAERAGLRLAADELVADSLEAVARTARDGRSARD
jgi:hypothetical protein